MPRVRTILPFAVAGLVAALLLPGEEVAGLLGTAPAVDSAEASDAPMANTAQPVSSSEVAPDSPRTLPTYVALNPQSLSTDAPELEAGGDATANRVAALPSPPVPELETMPATEAPLTGNLSDELPPDETTTGSLPEEPEHSGSGKMAYVGGTAVNMRVGPATSTARITTLQPGDAVSIHDMSGKWALVETASGESGWVYSTYLGDSPAAAQPRQTQQASASGNPQSSTRVTRVTSAAVYAGPTTRSERLFLLPPGEAVRVVERRGNWARVRMPSGVSGWVRVN